MDLRHLEYFVAVVQQGSILKAARKLNLSQPSLSVAMKQLEQELQTVLFERGARHIRLTETGKRLSERAESLLAMAESIRREITDLSQGTHGVLRLGAISSSAASLLDPHLIRFSRLYPEIRYEISEGNTFEQLEQLAAGQVDIAIVRTPFPDTDVEYLRLDRDTLAVVMKTVPAALSVESISVSLLKDLPLVVYRRFEPLLRRQCEKEGFSPSLLCLNDDARTCLQWARAALGITIVPYSLAAMFPDLIRKPIACPELNTETCLIWPKNRPLAQTAERFLHFMEQQHAPKELH